VTAAVRPLFPGRPNPLPEGRVGTVELCDRAGLTYRQCDFWTTCGLLLADENNPGHGAARSYPVAEVFVAATARQLIEAGFQLRPAVELARRAVAGEPVALLDGLVRIDPGEVAR